MSGLMHRPIGEVNGALVVLDMGRRLYIGLSRDEAYWHVVAPLPVDLVDANGTVLRRVGTLACSCLGGTYRGTCWRTKQAVAFEAGRGLQDPAWLAEGFDAPVGAGEAVESWRG